MFFLVGLLDGDVGGWSGDFVAFQKVVDVVDDFVDQ